MKKVFNLSVILAVLAAAFSFTSCSDDDDDAAAVDVKVAVVESTAAVTAISEEDIVSIELWKDGSKKQTITKGWQGDKGSVAYTFSNLEGGKYKVVVTTKTGASEKEFTIAGGAAESKTFTLEIGGGQSAAGSYISIKNEAVYTTSQANANAAAIEIVFDGKEFKSATESTNSAFKAEASAEVTNNATGCTFVTSTGFTGSIVAADALGDTAKVYTVTVTKSAK